MKPITRCLIAAALGCVLTAPQLSAAYPVTVVANPADLAKWTQQIAKMTQQINTANQVLQQAQTLNAFLGDPKGSIRNMGDLSRISNSLANIVGPGATADGLRKAAGTFDEAGRAVYAAQDLSRAIEGVKQTTKTFGNQKDRNVDIYEALFAAEQLSSTARTKIAESQKAREDINKKMQENRQKYASTSDESSRRVLEGEMATLQAQNAMLSDNERTMLVNVQLDRESRERAQDVKVLTGVEDAQREAAAQRQITSTQRRTNATETTAFFSSTTTEQETNWGDAMLTPASRMRAPTY